MKSNKSKRAEIKAQRLARAQRLRARGGDEADPRFGDALRSAAAREGLSTVPANQALLRERNHPFARLPTAYIDQAFDCKTCGKAELWTAKQQKWWYEVAQGSIDSKAVECRACRQARQAAKRSSLLHVQTARLRELGQQAPDEAAREEVEAALASKWHGIRTVAVGTIGAWWGAWRDPQDLERLKRWVESGNHRSREWPCVAAQSAIQAIAQGLRDTDMAWVLNWLLSSAVQPSYAHIVWRLHQPSVLDALNSPELRRAAHTDAQQAPRLLTMLAALNAHHPAWPDLARHYLQSPVIGRQARYLQYRLAALSAATASTVGGRG